MANPLNSMKLLNPLILMKLMIPMKLLMLMNPLKLMNPPMLMNPMIPMNPKKQRIKMARTDFNTLLEAGVHFGHLKRKWNPRMAPYIFMEKNGIHIIDLHKTAVKLDEAAAALKQIAKSGRRVLFVATKKQAKEIVAEIQKG